MGQVVETEDPTQFDKFQDLNDVDLQTGAIVVRLRSTGQSIANEVIAIPANPNYLNVPLYGEQVIVFSAIDGRTEDTKTDLYYYLPWINTHGILNNGIMPYIHDTVPEDKGYGTYAVSSPFKSKEPEQLSFEEKNIVAIQPYQGDNIIQDRFGSILRFTSTHKNLDAYSQEPFWDSDTAGDPLIALSCGVDGAEQEDGYFTIENPDKDAAFIYLSKSHKISNLTLAQPKVGKEVKPVSSYDKSQVVIGSNRLIFNARVEEIVLVAKKDVKIATPAWQTDMDEFFTLILAFMDEVLRQNENIQKGHAEIGTVAQENSIETHPETNVGPTLVPTNAAQYVASNIRSTVDNTNESLDIREQLQSIRDDFAKMQQ